MVTVYIISHKLFEISLLSSLLCIAKLKRLSEPKMQVNTNQYLFLPCVLSKNRFPLSSLCTDPPSRHVKSEKGPLLRIFGIFNTVNESDHI